MEEIGVVQEVKDSRVIVELKRGSQCKSCGMCMQTSDNKVLLLNVENTAGAQIGNKVQLSIAGGSVIKASFLVYGLPVIGLIAGALAGSIIENIFAVGKSFITVLSAFLGLFLGVAVSMIADRKAKKSGKYDPRIVKIIS